MFQRQVAQRVANRVVAQQQRKMGHGPVGPHLLGTRQADYIQQRNMYGELPSTPGEKNVYHNVFGMLMLMVLQLFLALVLSII
eukprot:UN10303